MEHILFHQFFQPCFFLRDVVVLELFRAFFLWAMTSSSLFFFFRLFMTMQKFLPFTFFLLRRRSISLFFLWIYSLLRSFFCLFFHDFFREVYRKKRSLKSFCQSSLERGFCFLWVFIVTLDDFFLLWDLAGPDITLPPIGSRWLYNKLSIFLYYIIINIYAIILINYIF